ncbi:DUF3078 domain-containing protein [Galbibacter sp. EGI 63066]|uniref:DUF3078 domain-containing protein n=1 Tax=Galbibacter sp. EGI 63066 TaxID=2993559 RepID=UPI002248E0C0|nr:DUF3078 domain-containing protein [Galbibacter sp. EGI 63066]MCX2681288.1 DUF3078 domain-containing protein [Galbibacter sp. EGI 63066]
MIRFSIFLFFLIFWGFAQAQEKPRVYTNERTQEVFMISGKDTVNLTKVIKKYKPLPPRWNYVNKVGVNISEIAFVNWNAGGNNSISALGNARFERNYKHKKVQWNNEILIRYGLNIQEGQKVRKSEDAFVFNSTLGFRMNNLSNWYFSSKANFNTQFANGYKYPDTDTPISQFMAPGYFLFGFGSEFSPEGKDFKLYISPITQKSTFVLDQDLADAGSFGVKKAKYDAVTGEKISDGQRIVTEIGFLVTNSYQTKLYENMFLSNRLTLYTDYLNSFGNVDVNWLVDVELKVNEYVVANVGTQLIYDNDIKSQEIETETGETLAYGPKIQFKQALGVGVIYNF